MRAQKSFLIAIIFLLLGFITAISQAQQAQDEFPTEEEGAGAKLVVTSVSGPATAIHNQTISVAYTVENQGTVASDAYYVDLYLSTDRTLDPAAERLLKNVRFSKGLAPGQSRRTSTKVLVPINGLSGNYYYGAVVSSSKKASWKQVSLARYSLGDDNDTVTDHQTGLVWQRHHRALLTWAKAKRYCADLDLGGYKDWRLPRIEELETIIDYFLNTPASDPLFDCNSNPYWSSNASQYDPDSMWYVNFNNGSVNWSHKSLDYAVRCVHGRALPTYTVPGAPTEVSAAAGNEQATVTFTAPASDGGRAILWYTVTSIPGGKTATGASSPITVTGLTTPGAAYTFTVTATNRIGTGPASSPSNSVTPVTVSGAPTEVTATSGNAQATITFTAPASDGGSPIISYTVTSMPGGKTATGASSPITVTGLTNGTEYYFTVTATNTVGPGPAGYSFPCVMPTDPATAYSVSGRVATSAYVTAISAVTMNFGNYHCSATLPNPVTTDSNGNWSQSGFTNPAGFVVSPSKDGYFFTPDSIYFSAARSDLNFVALWHEDRYVNNGDGTVTDITTGRIWQKGDDGVTRFWYEAGIYCSNLVLGGHDDWRLPTLEELHGIVYKPFTPTIEPVFECRSSRYWSSEYDVKYLYAYAYDFSDGKLCWDNRSNPYYVRCVRRP